MSSGGRRFPAHPLTPAEAEGLLRACGNSRSGRRNRALLVLLYRAGLRCSEALGLDLADLRVTTGGAVIRVRQPKGFYRGTPPRELGLDAKAAAMLQAWLELRGTWPGPVFRTRSGRQVTASYVRQLLPRLGRRAGIGRRVHPHALRHTFARQLYEEGHGLVEIMLALGHTKLSTTQTYLRHIGATEVVAITMGRQW